MKFVGKRCDSVVRRANEWLLLLFCVCLTTLLFVSSHSSSSSSQPTIITSSSSPSPLSFSLCFPASSFIHLLAFALSHSLPQLMQWYVFRAELAAVATLTDEAFGGGFFLGKISESFSRSNVFVVNEKQLLYHSLRNSQGGSICWR